MYNFKSVFYFYAVLAKDGLISEIGGKVFSNLDFQAESLVGEEFSQLLFWQHNESTPQKIINSINIAGSGKPLEFETTFRESASKISTIKAKFTPVFDADNQVERIVFSSVDVTEYFKEVDFYKKRSERFLYAAESAEVGLWFWNLATEELFTTPRCNEIFGFPPQEVMVFDKFAQVFHPEDSPRIEAALKESHTNLTDYNIDFRIILENRHIRWVSVRGKTFQEDGDLSVMMGSVRDITHRKLADERLQELFEAEKAARDEVEEANRAKDHFMALVSHELRSPLNSILGWAKILRSKEVDQETRRNALETIENSAKLQAKLISDLVDSAKIISGKMDFSLLTLSLSELVTSVYQSQKPLANEKKINFLLGEVDELKVLGDISRLQQVINNLVANAIKFTPENGEIIISLKEENKNALFAITDTGAGILEEDKSCIFKPYFQSSDSPNKTGLGLGLSIARAIVLKHGGKIWVKNNDSGVGCTFYVSLPIFLSRSVQKRPEANIVEVSDNKLGDTKILIVEDNDDSREVLHYYLDQVGADVYSVGSAKEGMDYLTSAKKLPNIIISDISMPEEDGYSFIEKVRKLPAEKGGSIPAIALTAFASSGDYRKSVEAGFQHHHVKPFEPEVLIADILKILRRDSRNKK
jgi:PAS domain S-box-containing protein